MNDKTVNKTGSENVLRELFFIFFANTRLVIDTITLIFVLVLAVAFLSPKQYTAQATLMVKGKRIDRNPEIIQQLQEKVQDITREDLNSEAEIIASVEVLKAAILNISKQSNIFSLVLDEATGLPFNIEEEKSLTKLIGKVTSSLDVKVVRSSQILELALVWQSPDEAQLILKTIVDEYLHYRNAVYKPEKAKSFYNSTLNSYQDLVDQKNAEITQVVNNIKATNSSFEIESNLDVQKGYALQLGELEHQKQSLTAELSYLYSQLERAELAIEQNKDGGDYTYTFFANIENLAIRELANAVKVKLDEYNSISRNFVATSTRAVNMKNELDKTYQTLVNEVRTLVEHDQEQLQSVIDTIDLITERKQALDKRNLSLARYQMKLEELRAQRELLNTSYINYYRLHEETQMFERTRDAAIDTQIILLTPAWANTSATFPNKRVLLPFGFIIAIILALTVAFINEYFDDRFKRPVDSEQYLGVPMLISLSDKNPKPKLSFSQLVAQKLSFIANEIWHSLKQKWQKTTKQQDDSKEGK